LQFGSAALLNSSRALDQPGEEGIQRLAHLGRAPKTGVSFIKDPHTGVAVLAVYHARSAQGVRRDFAAWRLKSRLQGRKADRRRLRQSPQGDFALL